MTPELALRPQTASRNVSEAYADSLGLLSFGSGLYNPAVGIAKLGAGASGAFDFALTLGPGPVRALIPFPTMLG
jgi:hypothetical protein